MDGNAFIEATIRGSVRHAALSTVLFAGSFVEGQLRSHRVRRRIYLVSSPLLVAFTWVGTMATRESATMLSWFGLTSATVFLAWGWVRWWRARPAIAA